MNSVNSSHPVSIPSWVKLVAFEALGIAVCAAAASVFMSLFPYFRSQEIADQLRPHFVYGAITLWVVLSLLAIRHHKHGKEEVVFLVAVVVVWLPTLMWLFVPYSTNMYNGVNSWLFFCAVCGLGLVSIAFSVLIALTLTRMSEILSEWFEGIFQYLGL